MRDHQVPLPLTVVRLVCRQARAERQSGPVVRECGCLIYLAALKGIPEDVYEAADLDGAVTRLLGDDR